VGKGIRSSKKKREIFKPYSPRDIMTIEFHLVKRPRLKNPVLIEGLPGLGLVGTIAASYLVEKLDMKLLGFVKSPQFPPIIAIHNFTPMYPVRLYYSTKHNLIVLLSEFVIPMDLVPEFAEALLEFGKKMKVSRIISLGSITIKGEQDTIYGITTDQVLAKKLLDNDVELIKEGATTGVTAILLAESVFSRLPTTSLLAEAHAEYADPRGAAMVLDVLNKVLDLKVDLVELEKEAKLIESKMKEIIAKSAAIKEKYKHMQEVSSMYG